MAQFKTTKVTKFAPMWNTGQNTTRIEAFYGPWKSVDEFTATPQAIEAIDIADVITIGVWTVEGNKKVVKEYWNPKGDGNFVLKHEGLATETFVDNRIAELIGGAPETLDTLKEITDAMEAHEGAYTELLANVGLKATKEYVDEQLALKADKEEIPSVDVFVEAITEDLETKATKEEVAGVQSTLDNATSNITNLEATKADKSALESLESSVNAELDTKASKEDLESLESSVNEVVETRATKDELNAAITALNASVATKADVDHIHAQYLTEHQNLNEIWNSIAELQALPHFTKDDIFGFIKEYIVISMREYLEQIAPESPETPELPTKQIYWALTSQIPTLVRVEELTAEDIADLETHPITYYYNEAIEPVEIKNESGEQKVVLIIVPESVQIHQYENGALNEFNYDVVNLKIGFDTYNVYAVYRIKNGETWYFGSQNDYEVAFSKN